MPTILNDIVQRLRINDRYSRSGHPLDACPYAALDPISTLSGYHYFSTDFEIYTGPATGGLAGGWQLDDVGTAAVALEDSSQFGSLQIATGGTEDNNAILQVAGEPWRYVVGKRTWCFARINLSDANDAEVIVGLTIATADPLGGTLPTDGIFFEKAETATEFDFHTRLNGASTENTLVTGTFTDGAYRIIGFTVDLSGNVHAYDGTTLDDLTEVATVNNNVSTLPTDEDLSIMLGIETGAALAKDLTVDWVFAVQER